MADYTRGNDRLHMAYSFDLLSAKFTPGHFRRVIGEFLTGAPDGWPSWSFSNHDVPRHVTRWLPHARDEDSLAKLAIAMLTSFPGTLGIYQGEELGLTETELTYDELTDPPALRFWPEVRGRDGCRTPMVWDAGAPNAGFSAVAPWLPVKAPQAARAVDRQEGRADSVLSAYRAQLAFRRERPELLSGATRFVDLGDSVLGIERSLAGKRLVCLFNLTPGAVRLPAKGKATPVGPSQQATVSEDEIGLGPSGFVFLEAGDGFSLGDGH
jgi:alpha-glucosidase